MRLAHLSPLFPLLLLLPACGNDTAASTGGANENETMGTPADDGTTPDTTATPAPKTVAENVQKKLESIDDAEAAKEAKPALESLTKQLEAAMTKAQSVADSVGLGEAAKGVMNKAAGMVSPELKNTLDGIATQVDRLMQNPQIQSAIGPVLQRLKAVVTG